MKLELERQKGLLMEFEKALPKVLQMERQTEPAMGLVTVPEVLPSELVSVLQKALGMAQWTELAMV